MTLKYFHLCYVHLRLYSCQSMSWVDLFKVSTVDFSCSLELDIFPRVSGPGLFKELVSRSSLKPTMGVLSCLVLSFSTWEKNATVVHMGYLCPKWSLIYSRHHTNFPNITLRNHNLLWSSLSQFHFLWFQLSTANQGPKILDGKLQK